MYILFFLDRSRSRAHHTDPQADRAGTSCCKGITEQHKSLDAPKYMHRASHREQRRPVQAQAAQSKFVSQTVYTAAQSKFVSPDRVRSAKARRSRQEYDKQVRLTLGANTVDIARKRKTAHAVPFQRASLDCFIACFQETEVVTGGASSGGDVVAVRPQDPLVSGRESAAVVHAGIAKVPIVALAFAANTLAVRAAPDANARISFFAALAHEAGCAPAGRVAALGFARAAVLAVNEHARVGCAAPVAYPAQSAEARALKALPMLLSAAVYSHA